MSTKKVIIAAYNEESSIKKVVATLPTDVDIIVVNDGSQDKTATIVANTRATLINNPVNLGQGGALETGIKYALSDPKAKYFATYDADGQHNPDDLKKMFAEIETNGKDIIMGSRFLSNSSNIPPLKILTLKLALWFTKLTTGLMLTDVHNGLRVFNRKFAEKVELDFYGMSHASEFYDIIKENNFSYAEFPVTIAYTEYSRQKGQSILNSVNIISDIIFKRK